jgi:hypothetical protein
MYKNVYESRKVKTTYPSVPKKNVNLEILGQIIKEVK